MSTVAAAPATVVPAGEWAIDPSWSSLEFEVKKLGLVTIKGRVPGFTGTIDGGDQPSIHGVVDATSITTFDETRDGHLQSPGLLRHVQRYPELRFESTAVETDGDELVVEGELTIKGITRPVDARRQVRRRGDRSVGQRANRARARRHGRTASTSVSNWNAPLPGGGFLLPDDVVLRATFAAVRAS